MDYGLYVAASGADAQSRRMEVLSHNLANVDTPGFKAEFAVLQARHSRALQDAVDVPGSGSINDLSSGVSIEETITDFTPGTVKQTRQPSDVALRGEGFFQVENAATGEKLLTRAGNFQVNANGEFLTQQGFRVLDSNGAPIVINPGSRFLVHPDGWIQHSGGGQMLSVVKPRSYGDLVRVGENAFRALGPLAEVPLAERNVQSGFLEMSGVSSIRSMMELIETSRAYEANVRMVQHHDQMTGSLVTRVLGGRS